MLSLVGIAVLAVLLLINQHTPGHNLGKIAAATVAAFGALFWITREGMRRNWWTANLDRVPAIRWHASSERAPDYTRWMDTDRILVGFCDAWLCVPWSAVYSATLTSHAVQLSFTPLGLDAWYLERGAISDEQWQQIIQLVRSKTIRVTVWGAVRR